LTGICDPGKLSGGQRVFWFVPPYADLNVAFKPDEATRYRRAKPRVKTATWKIIFHVFVRKLPIFVTDLGIPVAAKYFGNNTKVTLGPQERIDHC
jgi:hypothetical protein